LAIPPRRSWLVSDWAVNDRGMGLTSGSGELGLEAGGLVGFQR